jgi:DNA-binding MarR family transcriptional regulator
MTNDDEIHGFADRERLTHLLWEVGANTALLSEAVLADTPLTPASAGVLDVVAADPGISIAEMARRLPTSAQGISQLVSRLEKLEYLERRLGERGYGVALFITERGERARADTDERRVALEAQLAEALGQRSYDQLVQLLRRARPIVAQLAGRRPRGSRSRRAGPRAGSHPADA